MSRTQKYDIVDIIEGKSEKKEVPQIPAFYKSPLLDDNMKMKTPFTDIQSEIPIDKNDMEPYFGSFSHFGEKKIEIDYRRIIMEQMVMMRYPIYFFIDKGDPGEKLEFLKAETEKLLKLQEYYNKKQ